MMKEGRVWLGGRWWRMVQFDANIETNIRVIRRLVDMYGLRPLGACSVTSDRAIARIGYRLNVWIKVGI
jgi:hypothetical protein